LFQKYVASQHLLRWNGNPAQDCIAGSLNVFAPRRSTNESDFNCIMPRRQDVVSEANGLKIKNKLSQIQQKL